MVYLHCRGEINECAPNVIPVSSSCVFMHSQFNHIALSMRSHALHVRDESRINIWWKVESSLVKLIAIRFDNNQNSRAMNTPPNQSCVKLHRETLTSDKCIPFNQARQKALNKTMLDCLYTLKNQYGQWNFSYIMPRNQQPENNFSQRRHFTLCWVAHYF